MYSVFWSCSNLSHSMPRLLIYEGTGISLSFFATTSYLPHTEAKKEECHTQKLPEITGKRSSGRWYRRTGTEGQQKKWRWEDHGNPFPNIILGHCTQERIVGYISQAISGAAVNFLLSFVFLGMPKEMLLGYWWWFKAAVCHVCLCSDSQVAS